MTEKSEKRELTPLPAKPKSLEEELEKFKVEIAEIRQDFAAYQVGIQEMLISTFKKIISKMEELENKIAKN